MAEKNWICFGGGGHESEYCLHVAPYDHNDYIPDSISRRLEALLPDWSVCNRGSRIEIVNRKDYGRRDDEQVLAAVREVIGTVELDGEPQRKPPVLKLLAVYDGDLDRIVKCAIVRDREDCWDVKPLDPEYFDPKDWIGRNKAFHMAWWRIAKNDKSAEPIEGETFDTATLPALVLRKVIEMIG